MAFGLPGAVSRILSPVQGGFLEGAGVGGGADTCQASCAQQQLEGSAFRSVTSPLSVKTDLSSGWGCLGGQARKETGSMVPEGVSRKMLRCVWGIDCAFPEPPTGYLILGTPQKLLPSPCHSSSGHHVLPILGSRKLRLLAMVAHDLRSHREPSKVLEIPAGSLPSAPVPQCLCPTPAQP